MLDHINTLDQLEEEAKRIDTFLNITCSENPEECVSRGLDLSVYLARTGKMLADAHYWQDEAKKNSIVREIGQGLNISPSILKLLVDASCKRENYILKWLDRMNATITHQLDFLRTVISKSKAELQSFGNNR